MTDSTCGSLRARFESLRSYRYSAVMELPIACTLTEAEMAERRRTILNSVRSAVLGVTSLPLGYSYRFAPASEVLADLARLVDLERRCCSFLTFRIVVESGNQPICLEITGLAEAKAIIADMLGS